MRTFEDISKDYDLNSNGFVRSPGKFESEHWSTIDLYESIMNGFTDQTEFLDDIEYSIFFVDEDMRQKYGLSESVYAIVIHESDIGFIHTEWMDENDYNALVSEFDTEEYESESDYE